MISPTLISPPKKEREKPFLLLPPDGNLQMAPPSSHRTCDASNNNSNKNKKKIQVDNFLEQRDSSRDTRETLFQKMANFLGRGEVKRRENVLVVFFFLPTEVQISSEQGTSGTRDEMRVWNKKKKMAK